MILEVVLLAIGGPSPAASPEADAFQLQGVAAYQAGLNNRHNSLEARPYFWQSAQHFEQLWQAGRQTPDVAANMAQARLLAGDVGRAIRNYRLGLRVAPHDPTLNAGLEFARGQVAFPLTGEVADLARPRDPDPALHGLPVEGLGGLAVLAWAIGWFALMRGWHTGRGSFTLFAGLLIAGAILGATRLWIGHQRVQHHWDEPTAVVIGAGAELRAGNSDEYPRRMDGRLPAGTELRVLAERGGWMQVELSAGVVGWVKEMQVVPVDLRAK